MEHLGENPQGTGSQVGRGRGGPPEREDLRANTVMTDLPVTTGCDMWGTVAVLYLILLREPLLPSSRWG